MRFLASRLALWWAAPAALLSLFLPAPLGSWLAALSVLAAGLSLSLRGRWKLRPDAVPPEHPVTIDEACLLDVTAQIVRCTAQSRDLAEALHGVARVLVHELGADGLVTGRLDAGGKPWPANRAAGARAAAMSALAIQATRMGQPRGTPSSGYAVPVVRDGLSVAWLELRSVELGVDAQAFERLLAVVQRELSTVAQRGLDLQSVQPRAAARSASPALPGAAAPEAGEPAGRLAAPHVPAAIIDDTDSPDRHPRDSCRPDEVDALTGQGGAPIRHPLLTRYVQFCEGTGQESGDDAGQRLGFDPAALERLRALDPLGLNRLHERVVRAFESSARRLLPQMSDAARVGESMSVRQLANTLKSASESVGAVKLALQCAEIEAMTRAESPCEMQDCIDELIPEIEIVLSVLRGQRGSCT